MDPVPQAPELARAALAVTIVHGTFPRGPWQQLRRNTRALWTRLRGRQSDEAAMWLAPASQCDERWWFEPGSKFERDLVRRSGLNVVFDHFLWSGCNGFAERADAAHSLRAALRETACKHLGVPQVVLAHSHGGTVAVKALDTRDELRGGGETPPVRALLTLGTPFVQLAWRGGQRPETGWLIADLLSPMLRLLGPVMALDLLWHSDGVAQVVAAGVLVIASLVAALRASAVAATTIIAIVLSLGGWVLLWHLFAAAALLSVGSLFSFALIPKPALERLAQRINNNRMSRERFVEEQPLCLSCPLLAVRAPRDEASLVIGLAQLVQWLWYIAVGLADLTGRGLAAGFDWVMKPTVFGIQAVYLAVLLAGHVLWLVNLVYPLFDTWAQNWVESWFLIALMVPTMGLGVALVVLVIVVLAVLGALLLVWALPAMVISLTTGREAFLLPGLTQLDAEPLPNACRPDGLQRAEMDLEILYEARLTGLNHSLYDAPEVRERIAIWLREQAGAPPVWLVKKPMLTRYVPPNDPST